MTKLDYFKQAVETWQEEDIDKCDSLLDYFIDWAEYIKYPKVKYLPTSGKVNNFSEDRPPVKPPHP